MLICMLSFTILVQGKPTTANFELVGEQIYELKQDYILVDFTAGFNTIKYRPLEPLVRKIKQDRCRAVK